MARTYCTIQVACLHISLLMLATNMSHTHSYNIIEIHSRWLPDNRSAYLNNTIPRVYNYYYTLLIIFNAIHDIPTFRK